MTLAAQRDLLALVLDVLIPAGGGFPGGGAIAVDHVLSVAGASPELESLIARGLQLIDEAAGPTGLASLGADDCENVLRRVERSHPEFFDMLVRHTYEGYYSHATVVARLGLEPGPLHPHGHRIEPVELPDLQRVTARGAIYRST